MIGAINAAWIETILHCPVALGLYFMLRVSRYPDLSADHLFSFGGLLGASLFLTSGHWFLAALFASLFSALVGGFTAFQNVIFRVPKLLSGLITFTILYSINLRVFGKPNVSLNADVSLWDLTFFCLIVLAIFQVTQSTVIRNSILFTSNNGDLAIEIGIPTKAITCIGVMIPATLVGYSGFATASYFGFADVGLGLSMLVNGLAAVMISSVVERVTRGKLPISLTLFISVFAYSVTVGIVMTVISTWGGRTTDVKLISGIILILLVFISSNRRQELDLFR